MKTPLLFLAALLLLLPPAWADKAATSTPAPAAIVREERKLEGWSVHLDKRLLDGQSAATAKALELLAKQLQEIVKVVPAPAVAELQKVPLWISPEYPGIPPRAEYHPGVGWLKDNGRDPVMAKGVEFTNVRNFEAETLRMPNFALHELAHAYHDRVLGNGHPGVLAAFRHARDAKLYDNVERWSGPGWPMRRERAYAMTNEMEYFAETTEAFFSRNDFFPFVRAELEKHDPDMTAVLATVWKTTPAPAK